MGCENPAAAKLPFDATHPLSDSLQPKVKEAREWALFYLTTIGYHFLSARPSF
jgi:hypothetical protein